jgi:uncharacterized membrane protein
MERKKTGICQIDHKEWPIESLMPASSVRDNLVNLIRLEHPDWDENGYISLQELANYRDKYVRSMLSDEKGELSFIDIEVVNSLKTDGVLSRNINEEIIEYLSFGQRIADKVAEFGGSWKFIIIFVSIILVWMLLNIIYLANRAFDPYPFILLNLVLSCIAAVQAPVIMMSQNRQETKDRLRALNDYQVNLKAELEIRQLHEKMDHLLIKQGQRMLEIQEIQLDLMEQILNLSQRMNNHLDESQDKGKK